MEAVKQMEAVKHNITIKPALYSRIDQVDFSHINFGEIPTDHMLVADYKDGQWGDPVIQPFEDIHFAPSLATLHYAQSVFEGMKAFRSGDRAWLFRPEKNYARLNHSCNRMCMPEIPKDIFMEGLKELVRLDKQWIPTSDDASLYLRPFCFASDEYVGVRISNTYKFIIICSPAGPYYPKPVALQVNRELVRAFPGGTGDIKAAGNYALSLYGTQLAKKDGYDNVLWLDGIEHKYVEECGTMNIYFVIDGVAVTPALGTILEGVTRDSVKVLLQDMGIKVEERRISVDELAEAHKAGKLEEAFGTGTAATISHVAKIGLDGVDMVLPPVEERKVGPALLRKLNDIRYGRVADPYGWMMEL
jgi:branched-chain amino acid aminotransferase